MAFQGLCAKPSVPLPRRFSLEGVRVPVRRPLPTAANQQGEYARQENQKENSRQEKSGPVMSFFPQRSLRPSGRGFFLKLVPPGLRVPSFTPSFRSKCPFLPAHQGRFRTTRQYGTAGWPDAFFQPQTFFLSLCGPLAFDVLLKSQNKNTNEIILTHSEATPLILHCVPKH